MWRILGVWLVLLGMAGETWACNRCGIFGRGCRYQAYHAQHVEHYRAVDAGDVYVVNNNYPAPLVAGGATLYSGTGGYQQLVAPTLDPTLYFKQEYLLKQAAQEAGNLRAERTDQLFLRALELMAPANEAVARGVSARMVLDGVGLNQTTGVQQSNSSLMINRDQYGRLQVQTLTAEQAQLVTEKLTQNLEEKPGATTPPAGSKWPLMAQYCGKCHGVDVASPKGEMHIGDDPNVAASMKAKFFEITERMSTQGAGRMPPAGAPQPTDEQRRQIVNEIGDIIKSHQKE